jgi:hypothetical protein
VLRAESTPDARAQTVQYVPTNSPALLPSFAAFQGVKGTAGSVFFLSVQPPRAGGAHPLSLRAPPALL